MIQICWRPFVFDRAGPPSLARTGSEQTGDPTPNINYSLFSVFSISLLSRLSS